MVWLIIWAKNSQVCCFFRPSVNPPVEILTKNLNQAFASPLQCPWKWRVAHTHTYRVSVLADMLQLRVSWRLHCAASHTELFSKRGPSGEAGLWGKPDRGNHTQLRPWQPIWLPHIMRRHYLCRKRKIKKACSWQRLCGLLETLAGMGVFNRSYKQKKQQQKSLLRH